MTVAFGRSLQTPDVYPDLVNSGFHNPTLDFGTVTPLPSGVLHLHEQSRRFEVTLEPAVEPSPAQKLEIVDEVMD